MGQQQAIHKFVLGSKVVEGKSAEFQYDKGWYSITEIIGEERNVIYKSKNAQEAYVKWNVYIGRKKERIYNDERKKQREEQGKEIDGDREKEKDRDKEKEKDRDREKEKDRDREKYKNNKNKYKNKC